MLQIKNLVKVYKPKSGQEVVALNNISLTFPKTGMVFLLGKSGSGKSTLLNVLGGLDTPTSGKIFIKGEQTINFKQQHFDSYRNTYVGFIFQEYNLLDNFTVGANIALALELQGMKADNSKISEILREVDLEGFGNRKPNELSGGQKQRVAIARALIKNPAIIMADEPTGALDSSTGRQVLDTLKKLSENKLVIVVSHDREFAMNYGDRIIELKDGKVIGDITRNNNVKSNNSLVYKENTIEVPVHYELTEQDRIDINNYIKALENPAHITINNKIVGNAFDITNEDNIDVDSSGYSLIKSKLSIKNAFKIGTSSLKHKKGRLITTIFLSIVSFILFGLADTVSSYDYVNSCTDSIIDSNITYASFVKKNKITYDDETFYYRQVNLTKNDIDTINNDLSLNATGVIESNDLSFENMFSDYEDTDKFERYKTLYPTSMVGYSTINSQEIIDYGFEYSGVLPKEEDEIAITKYTATMFIKTNIYKDFESILNTILTTDNDKKYKITAIIDTNFDDERFASLLDELDYEDLTAYLAYIFLSSELSSLNQYSLNNVCFVGDNFKMSPYFKASIGYARIDTSDWTSLEDEDINFLYDPSFTKLSLYSGNIEWVDGKKEALADDELILPSNYHDLEIYASFGTYGGSYYYNYEKYNVVGYIDDMVCITSDSIFNNVITDNPEAKYSYCVDSMPLSNRKKVKDLVSYSIIENDVKYSLSNSVCYELENVDEAFKVLKNVFTYVGLFFAIFAMLLLSSFIRISVIYKKRDIGILRAIGSRSGDVFEIFFAESFVIALINATLSIIFTSLISKAINNSIKESTGFMINALSFGIRQVVVLILISLITAAIATFLPVRKAARKKPVDAINNR